MSTFKGIRPGAVVCFKAYAGIGLDGIEHVVRKANVNPLLIFDSHVVVNYGSCGTVVSGINYISHKE